MMNARNPKQWLAFLLFPAVMSFSTANAQLASSILNADFEAGIPTGSTYNPVTPSWDEFADFADGAGFWDNTSGGITNTHPVDGLGAASLIVRPDGAGADDAWLFQSLGTIAAGDLGETYSLSADFGGRDFYSGRAEGTYGADVDLSVAFRTGTTSTGTLGAALGTVGTRNIVTMNAAQEVGSIIDFTTHTATFTPTAGDIGTEVFAVVSVKANSFLGGNGQRQYTVDNLAIGTIDLGDFNNDTVIDLVDYGILRDNLYTHLDGPVTYADGDINFSSTIDLEDFNNFLSVYPGGAAAFHADLAAATVPEPAGFTLALLGMVGIVSFGRRKRA